MAKAKQQNNKKAGRWTQRQAGEMKDRAAVSVEGQDIYSVTHASIQRIRARFPPCPALSSETWALKRATTVNPSVRRREGPLWRAVISHPRKKQHGWKAKRRAAATWGVTRQSGKERKISLRPHGGGFASVSCPVLPRKLSSRSVSLSVLKHLHLSVTGSVTAKCNTVRWTELNWKLTFFSAVTVPVCCSGKSSY